MSFWKWGVDSYNPADIRVNRDGHPIDRDTSASGDRLYDHLVRVTGREPEFWGRYLNERMDSGSSLRQGEADYIFRRSGGRCRILLVYNGIPRDEVSTPGPRGTEAGRRAASSAIVAAARLGVPPRTRIYADLEGWMASPEWLLGWWERMYESPYLGLGGLYGRGGNVDRIAARDNPLLSPGRYGGVWSTVLPDARDQIRSRELDELMRGTATGLDYSCHVWTARPRLPDAEPPTQWLAGGPAAGALVTVWQYYGSAHGLFDYNVATLQGLMDMWQA